MKISPNTPVVYCDNLKKSCLQFSGDHTSNNLMILQKAPFLGYLGFSSALTRRTSMLASSQKHGNTCVVLCGCITCDLMQYHFQFISFPVIQATIFYCILGLCTLNNKQLSVFHYCYMNCILIPLPSPNGKLK